MTNVQLVFLEYLKGSREELRAIGLNILHSLSYTKISSQEYIVAEKKRNLAENEIYSPC